MLLIISFLFILMFAFIYKKNSVKKLSLQSPLRPSLEPYSLVRKDIRTGDLLMTRAKGTISDLHCKWLNTPIAHVGIAVVENEHDPLSRIFMFESSLPRGAQLRDLEDYAREGVHDVYIRHLNREELMIPKDAFFRVIERFSKSAYSFQFLADIPQKIFDYDFDYNYQHNVDEAYSCADLVYKIYSIFHIVKPSKRRWFPKDFFLDKVKFEKNALSEIRSVSFDDLDNVEKKRISSAFLKLFSLFSSLSKNGRHSCSHESTKS